MINYKINREKITTFDRWLSAAVEGKGLERKDKERVGVIINHACWSIWRERCDCVFQNKKPEAEKVISRAQQAIEESYGVIEMARRIDMNKDDTRNKWVGPESEWIKINTDGAYKNNTNEAGIGVVARDCKGELVGGVGCLRTAQSSLTAEAFAVKEGMKLARQLHLSKVILETDSQEIVVALRGKKQGKRWEIDPIVRDIDAMENWFQEVKIQWVSRKANQAADWVASQVKKKMCPLKWVNMPPSSLVFILNKDGLPAPPT